MARGATSKPVVTVVLNRLLRVLSRSLPMYLQDAKPYSRGDQQPIHAALDNLVADQRTLSCRVAQAILDARGQPTPGPFPLVFASINDAGLNFLLGEVIECHRRDIAVIEGCVADLTDFPELHALAQEILGNAQGHLDILQGLTTGNP
jgi:hypothetical protein